MPGSQFSIKGIFNLSGSDGDSDGQKEAEAFVLDELGVLAAGDVEEDNDAEDAAAYAEYAEHLAAAEAAEVAEDSQDADQEAGGDAAGDNILPAEDGFEDASEASEDSDSEEESLERTILALKAKEQAEVEAAKTVKRNRTVKRYFTQLSSKCFNCGKVGHVKGGCTSERAKPCYLCSHRGHEERDCPNQLCFKCMAPGHLSRDCKAPSRRSPRMCMLCGSHGHDMQDCTARPPKGNKHLSNVRCFVCGTHGHLCCGRPKVLPSPKQFCANCASQGHWHFDCPQRDRMSNFYDRFGTGGKGRSKSPGACFNCGKTGHIKMDCPELSFVRGRSSGPGYRRGSSGGNGKWDSSSNWSAKRKRDESSDRLWNRNDTPQRKGKGGQDRWRSSTPGPGRGGAKGSRGSGRGGRGGGGKGKGSRGQESFQDKKKRRRTM